MAELPYNVFAKLLPDATNPANLLPKELGLDYATGVLKYKGVDGTLYTLSLSNLNRDIYTPLTKQVWQDVLTNKVGIGKNPSDSTAIDVSTSVTGSLLLDMTVTATANFQDNLAILVKDSGGVVKDVIQLPVLSNRGAIPDIFNVTTGTLTRFNKVEATFETLYPTVLTNNTIYEISKGHAGSILASDSVSVTTAANKDNTAYRGQVYLDSNGSVYYIADKVSTPTFPKYIASSLGTAQVVRYTPCIPYIDANYTLTLVKIRAVSSTTGSSSVAMFKSNDTAIISSILAVKELDSNNVEFVNTATVDGTNKLITGLATDVAYECIVQTNETISILPKIVYSVSLTDGAFLKNIQLAIKAASDSGKDNLNISKFAIKNTVVKRDDNANIVTNDTYYFKDKSARLMYDASASYFRLFQTNGGNVGDGSLRLNVLKANGLVINAPTTDGTQIEAGTLTGTWNKGTAIVDETAGSSILSRFGFVGTNKAITAFYAGLANAGTKTNADSWLYADSTGIYARGGAKVWDSGNDGAGSGMDTDLFQGQTVTEFARNLYTASSGAAASKLIQMKLDTFASASNDSFYSFLISAELNNAAMDSVLLYSVNIRRKGLQGISVKVTDLTWHDNTQALAFYTKSIDANTMGFYINIPASNGTFRIMDVRTTGGYVFTDLGAISSFTGYTSVPAIQYLSSSSMGQGSGINSDLWRDWAILSTTADAGTTNAAATIAILAAGMPTKSILSLAIDTSFTAFNFPVASGYGTLYIHKLTSGNAYVEYYDANVTPPSRYYGTYYSGGIGFSGWQKVFQASDATVAPTANKLAMRDGSGDLKTNTNLYFYDNDYITFTDGTGTYNFYYNNGTLANIAGNNVKGTTLQSTVATGTAPLTVTSTTAVANLNADMVDGYHMNQSVLTTASPTFVKLTSTVATGTAPLTVASTTVVTNLNADMLDGYHANSAASANSIAQRDVNGWLYAVGFNSPTPTGTAPITVASTTIVPNLNVDMVDGYHLDQDVRTTASPTFVRLVSTQATGTAPFTVASTTVVANLNADSVDGYHLDQDVRTTASPTLVRLVLTQATGTAPMTVTSTTVVTNLNADTVDGYHLNQDVRSTASPSFVAITSTVANGTAPLTVTSSTKVTNLNADSVDGYHFNQDVQTTASPTFVRLTSTVATGTAPLTVTSTTVVTNLNADMVDGLHTNTGSTVNTIAARDASANLTANKFISTVATGTAPLTVTSTTVVDNLNADYLDGLHASSFVLITGYSTSTSATGYIGQYTKIASIDINAANQQGNLILDLMESETTTTAKAMIYFKVKQGTMATAPTIELMVTNTDQIDATNFVAVTTSNTASLTTVDLYYKVYANNSTINIVPTMRAGNANAITCYNTQAYVSSLPTGTQTTGSYLQINYSMTFNMNTGTAPFNVLSTTMVANLNADMVDGLHTSTASTANTIVARDVNGWVVGVGLASTVATGTAPLTVTSTTLVSNLNADMLDGYHAGNSSGQIPVSNGTANTNLNADMVDGLHTNTGSTVNTIAARDANANLTANRLISTVATGTAPLTVTSTTVVSNLNADMVDGKHSTDFVLVNGTQAMTGALTLSGDPTSALHAVTKQYIDRKIGIISQVSLYAKEPMDRYPQGAISVYKFNNSLPSHDWPVGAGVVVTQSVRDTNNDNQSGVLFPGAVHQTLYLESGFATYHRYAMASMSYTNISAWSASKAVALNAYGMPSTLAKENGYYYKCTTAGTTGTTEPAWPTTAGATVTDGSVVWTFYSSFWSNWDRIFSASWAGTGNGMDVDMVDGAHAGTGANNILKLDGSGLVGVANIPGGTNSQTFQLQAGSSGVKLKNTSGTLDIRNSADNGYANIRVQDITVNGVITSPNTEVAVSNNIILLDSDYSASAANTVPSGIQVERGTQSGANASLIWSDGTQKWMAGLAGSEQNIVLTDDGRLTNLTVAGKLPWAHLTGVPTEFNPTAHAATHASGGTDPITPSAIGALALAGGTLTGNLTFQDDGEGINFAGGSIYKQVGSGLKLKAHVDNIGVAIQNVSGADVFIVKTDGTGMTYSANTIWHAGNDNTFMRDRGQLGTAFDFNTKTAAGLYYINLTNWTGSTNYPTNSYSYGLLEVIASGATVVTQVYYPHNTSGTLTQNGAWTRTKYNASDWGAWQKIWTDTSDGAGSGLDADLLDGYHASSFGLLTSNNAWTGTNTMANITLTGNILATDTAEHAFKTQSTNVNWGYYVNTTAVGAYDWQNNRPIFHYNPAYKTLGLNTSAITTLSAGGVHTTNNILDDGNGAMTLKGNLNFTIASVSTSTPGIWWNGLTDSHGIFVEEYGGSQNTRLVIKNADDGDNDYTVIRNGATDVLEVHSTYIKAIRQLQSTVTTGTAPLSIASTTMVTNLNSDMLDDRHLVDITGLDISGSYSTTVYYRKIADLPATSSTTCDRLVVELHGGGWNVSQMGTHVIEFSNRDGLNFLYTTTRQTSYTSSSSNIVVYDNSVYVKYTGYVKGWVKAYFTGTNGTGAVQIGAATTTAPTGTLNFDSSTAIPHFRIESGEGYITGNKIWHQGNDGSGSGLDADLLDGLHSSSFMRSDLATTNTAGIVKLQGDVDKYLQFVASDGTTSKGAIRNNSSGSTIISSVSGSVYLRPLGDLTTTGEFLVTQTTMTYAGNTVWHAGNDGASSGLDADLLDGQQASAFASSSNTSEQTLSASEVRVQSTTTTERFSIVFNDSDGSLDFVYYPS